MSSPQTANAQPLNVSHLISTATIRDNSADLQSGASGVLGAQGVTSKLTARGFQTVLDPWPCSECEALSITHEDQMNITNTHTHTHCVLSSPPFFQKWPFLVHWPWFGMDCVWCHPADVTKGALGPQGPFWTVCHCWLEWGDNTSWCGCYKWVLFQAICLC